MCYLLGRSEFGLILNLEQFKYGERMKLLAYSDSDWAGHHGSRKSASSGCLMIDGILLYSSSRTQGLIALSSAEAEVYAAVSTCCDAIYMKRCLEFVFKQNVSIQLLIDNSAARQMMSAGVGRVRHLSVKILWLQQQVEKKMISVAAVASSANVADLGTKRLPCHTMRRLMYEVGVYDGSGRVGVEEFEEHQQKALIKRVMNMTSTTPSLNTRSSGNLQLALLTAMLPNALGSRVGGQSIFWMTSITIPVWFVVVIVLMALAVAWYLINEIRGLRQSLYSWRDLCNEMDSDDREVRRTAMRRYQRTRRMMTPSTYKTTEVGRDGLLQDFAETTTGGQRIQENEIPLRVEVLRNIGQHMQLNARENSVFMRAFSELNPREHAVLYEQWR